MGCSANSSAAADPRTCARGAVDNRTRIGAPRDHSAETKNTDQDVDHASYHRLGRHAGISDTCRPRILNVRTQAEFEAVHIRSSCNASVREPTAGEQLVRVHQRVHDETKSETRPQIQGSRLAGHGRLRLRLPL